MDNSMLVFDKVLADAMEIKDKGNFLPDCTTKEGYEASKRFVLDVTTPARTSLAKAHKEAKAYWLEGGRNVDSKKKELEEMLLAVEQPHKEACKAIDDEVKRVKAEKEAAIQNGIDKLKSYADLALNNTSTGINELIEECSCFDCDPEVYAASTDFIVNLHGEVMGKLSDALVNALQFEEMKRKQAEIELEHAKMAEARALAERQEREAMQREAMRAEAEESARQQIEHERLSRIAAEESAKKAAEQAEARRIADIEQARLNEIERQRLQAEQEAREAAAREADKKHRAKINNQAVSCLVAGGLTESDAITVIKLIASKNVAHVQINY